MRGARISSGLATARRFALSSWTWIRTNPDDVLLAAVMASSVLPRIALGQVATRVIEVRIEDLVILTLAIRLIRRDWKVGFQSKVVKARPFDFVLIAYLAVAGITTLANLLVAGRQPLLSLLFWSKEVEYAVFFWLIRGLVVRCGIDVALRAITVGGVIAAAAGATLARIQPALVPLNLPQHRAENGFFFSVGPLDFFQLGASDYFEFAGYAMLALSAAIILETHSTDSRDRNVAGYAKWLILIGTLLSGSRTAFVASIATVLVGLIIGGLRREQLGRALVVAVLSLTALAVGPDALRGPLERLVVFLPGEGPVLGESFRERVEDQFPLLAQAISAHPVFGNGKGFRTFGTDQGFTRLFAETGVVGFALFLGFLGLVARNAVMVSRSETRGARMVGKAVLLCLVAFLVANIPNGVLYVQRPAIAFWFILGCTGAALTSSKGRLEHPDEIRELAPRRE